MLRSIGLLFLCLIMAGTRDALAQIIFTQGFESYSPEPFKPVAWMRAFDIEKVFPGWTNDNYWPLEICSCKDPRDESARYYNYCDGYRVTPHTGCNHARLWYGTRAGSPGMETYGSGPYLIRDFAEPLEMGQRYRLSTWIYLVDDGKVDRARLDSITAHIGAQLMYKRFVPVPVGEMYPGAQLLLDTVRYNEWYEVSWTFKPLCDLRRLVIGTFRNRAGPPTHGGNDGISYYLDDLNLERLPDDPAALASTTGVCYFADTSLVEAYPVGSAGTSVYFATNDARLDDSSRAVLDTYATLLGPYRPLAFSIYGFADRQRGDNQALSDARIDAVREHLLAKHKLQPFQYLAKGFGDSRSASSVLQEDRRVELRLEPELRAEIPYRYALEQTWAGNFPEALRALRMWSVAVRDHQAALIDFDPRLAALRRTPGYAAFAKTHFTRYRTYKHPASAKTLDSLFLEDQRYRTLAPRVKNLNAYFAAIDSTDVRWKVGFDTDEAGWRAHDAAGLAFAQTWVARNGWPQRSEVGQRGATAIVYAYLHGEDTAAMRQAEPLLEIACRQGEARWLDYALLVDRRLVDSGRPQRYGTQYRMREDGTAEIVPVEDEAEMRRLRLVLGIDER